MATLKCKLDTAHRDTIHDAKLNYYGTRLATCSSDRLIKIFEVKPNGQTFPVAELSGHSGPVWQLSWAHPKHDGILASASYDKKVMIWQETGGRWQKCYEWNGHEASVNGLSFAPSQYGLLLATAGADSTVAVLSFNSQTSQWDAFKIIKAHDQGVNAVSWAPAVHTSPHGIADQPYERRIVTCGNDSLVKIWLEDENGWECEKSLQGHTDFVRDVAWCPVVNHTTHSIVSCGQDRSVILWRCNDLSQGEWSKKLFDQANGTLWHVSWSMCGSVLSVSGEDNKITLWKENLQNQWEKIEDGHGER